ncbi:HugZ family protein [Desertibaculum subflavum]|uniref:HugZ family pyridoxamine 5'-phosphate oxidase n=1 Tax=Desertibaculum subflavum TaxID=2268458 RepID=UPI000E6661EE
MSEAASATPADQARALIRARPVAALSTALAADGWPYGSLVLVATAIDGTPLLLISTLAEHSRNLAADDRVSLLFEATSGLADPLTGARVTLLGQARPSADPLDRQRFLRRHPEAEMYAGFKDFGLYRVAPLRAHLVAGFGRIHWIDGSELLTIPAPALAEAEAGIVTHMNDDHLDAIQLYAARLLGLTGGGWRMTGCDPEGCDLRREAEVARLKFGQLVQDAAAARTELVRLVKQARAAA